MELAKLDNHAVPIEGGLVNWLLFLKGVDKSNWEVLTMNEPILKKTMDTLEFLSHDAELADYTKLVRNTCMMKHP